MGVGEEYRTGLEMSVVLDGPETIPYLTQGVLSVRLRDSGTGVLH